MIFFAHGLLGYAIYINYSVQIFDSAGVTDKNSKYFAVALQFSNLLFSLLFGQLLRRFERKAILLASLTLVSTFTLSLGVFQMFEADVSKFFAIVSIFLARGSYDLGALPLPMLMVSDFTRKSLIGTVQKYVVLWSLFFKKLVKNDEIKIS